MNRGRQYGGRVMLLVLYIAGLATLKAEGQMWQCTEPDGGKRFTNIQADASGCQLMSLRTNIKLPAPSPTLPPSPSPPSPSSPPSLKPARETQNLESFPKISAGMQQQRELDRRKILEKELETEQRNLQEAQHLLAEQEATRFGNERNYQRVLDRLAPFQKAVLLHEENVANLRKELTALP